MSHLFILATIISAFSASKKVLGFFSSPLLSLDTLCTDTQYSDCLSELILGFIAQKEQVLRLDLDEQQTHPLGMDEKLKIRALRSERLHRYYIRQKDGRDVRALDFYASLLKSTSHNLHLRDAPVFLKCVLLNSGDDSRNGP